MIIFNYYERYKYLLLKHISASLKSDSRFNANNELEKSLRTQYKDNSIIKTLTEYHYDTFGRRITKYSETRNLIQSKEQLTQSRQTQHQHTHMLWDSDLPIQEYTDTHVYTTIYDQGSFVPVARLSWLRDDLPRVANDDIESLDNENEQDGNLIQVYHYHNDQLGTPNELTNEKGEVVWLADYEAWGEARVEICWVSRVKNSLGNCFSGARRNDSAVKLVPQDESCARVGGEVLWREQVIDQIQVSQNELQPIRFQGQHFDEETGLSYNRFRYYDPDMWMFTSRDPIGLRGGDNVFAYAPNPIGWVDPLGLEPYGLGSGPYSQSNTLRQNGIDKKVAQALTAWHFEGRDARNGLHPTYNEVRNKRNGWSPLSEEQSIFHDDGVGKKELKYVHPDGREAVFNGDCLCPEIRPQYKATYNYINPGVVPENWYNIPGWDKYVKDMIGHGVVDVLPYLGGGNVRGDEPERYVPPSEEFPSFKKSVSGPPIR
uniref:RHS repeat domain-containing protein n=1 Tax=uncultured Psychrobacter sp. TaxID=259303 RepID=UPI002598E854|nr:RHS repeat-associated core domain-containing protein [uncultured Psychrobacter sp.]